MPRFDDFIVYADESGDHTLHAVDPSYPMFVLALCVLDKHDYATAVAPAVTEFKFKYFGHDQVILHELDIRKNRGPFAIVRDASVRHDFMESLNHLINDAPFTLIASAVQKDLHLERYAEPANPYHIALQFGLERIFLELRGRGCSEGRTYILFERRGHKEDSELELEFRRICGGANWHNLLLPFEAVFCDKKCNSPGLQLADLLARPIGRKVLNPEQPNRAYEILQRKFRRSPGGDELGWGLKIFP